MNDTQRNQPSSTFESLGNLLKLLILRSIHEKLRPTPGAMRKFPKPGDSRQLWREGGASRKQNCTKLRPLIVDDGMARILRLGRDYELSLP